jgi:NitT/TauT family transport system substrate-binding protein
MKPGKKSKSRSGSAFSVFAVALAVAMFCRPMHAVELEKIKIGGVFLDSDFSAMPVGLAQELGFYKAEGLDVDLANFNGGGQLMTAFAAGQVFIAEAGGPSSGRGTSEGVPITVVAELKPHLDDWGMFVLKDSPIHSLKDLKPGMKIGMSSAGSNSHLVAILLTAMAGISPDDATYLPLGSTANNLIALKKGDIDMISIYSPASVALEMKGEGSLVMDAGKLLPLFSSNVISANPSYIKSNPETVRKVLRAIFKSTTWMKANPGKTIQRMQDLYRIAPDVAAELYKREIDDYSTTGVINVEALKFVVDASVKYKFFDRAPQFDKVYDERFTPVSTN